MSKSNQNSEWIVVSCWGQLRDGMTGSIFNFKSAILNP